MSFFLRRTAQQRAHNQVRIATALVERAAFKPGCFRFKLGLCVFWTLFAVGQQILDEPQVPPSSTLTWRPPPNFAPNSWHTAWRPPAVTPRPPRFNRLIEQLPRLDCDYAAHATGSRFLMLTSEYCDRLSSFISCSSNASGSVRNCKKASRPSSPAEQEIDPRSETSIMNKRMEQINLVLDAHPSLKVDETGSHAFGRASEQARQSLVAESHECQSNHSKFAAREIKTFY
jgi:hypothetical protein